MPSVESAPARLTKLLLCVCLLLAAMAMPVAAEPKTVLIAGDIAKGYAEIHWIRLVEKP